MNCPYCKSDDIIPYASKTEIGKEGDIEIWACYNCSKFFERRNVSNCGKQTFHQGDNYPEYPNANDLRYKIKELQEHDKFKNMGIVPKKTKDLLNDLWIDLWQFLKGDKSASNNQK